MARTGPAARRPACPQCGALVHSTDRTGSIGSPFSECAGCGGFVGREGVSEWKLLSSGARLMVYLGVLRRAILVGLALALLHALWGAFGGRPWDLLEAGIALGAGSVIGGLWQGSRTARAIGRSRRRMGDPMYLAKLMKYGMAGGEQAPRPGVRA